jgi:enterochelin esterase family protein
MIASGRRLAIEELEDGMRHGHVDIDGFIAHHSFPLVEGTSVTFVWRGEASAVNLRQWVFGLPSSRPLRRLHGTDLWAHTMELPSGSRVEYKFELIRGHEQTWIEDPLNDARATDPFGANSVCHCDGYEVPDWIHEHPTARRGRIEERRIYSPAFGGEREVQVYIPARFRETRHYPLLVVHDGGDYLVHAGLKTVLDNLIHRLEIPSMIVALTSSPNRMEEYTVCEPHARFLVEDLVPTLEREFPLVQRPSSRGLMGASLGAVATLSAAAHAPGFFGHLLLQSGTFAFSDIGQPDLPPALTGVADFVNAYRADPVQLADRIFMTCGIYESLIYENRSLVPILQSTDMEVRFSEARDGHNWENWRDRLGEGLSWLFPGPLWMVYE